jgi:septal ring factor EnvC (AmiA/AmiB activator)
MKYQARINARIAYKEKIKLEAIKKENNDITVRYILEYFIKDYCSTNPKGIKIKIKEIENDIKEIEDQISSLYENKTKLEIELKTYKDKLNKTLDSYQ